MVMVMVGIRVAIKVCKHDMLQCTTWMFFLYIQFITNKHFTTSCSALCFVQNINGCQWLCQNENLVRVLNNLIDNAPPLPKKAISALSKNTERSV